MSSSMIEKILKKPHVVISFLALFLMAGIIGYNKNKRNLFPNSNYPEVAVVVIEPGASAKSIASNVAVPIEEELYSIDKIRRAHSTTIDEVTVIRAEFDYSKDIATALNDVTSSIAKVKSNLPKDIKEPQIIKITEATAPIEVVSLSSKKGANISLEDIRDLAEGKLKKELLMVDGVANVEIFGGYKKELQIIVDKTKLDSLHLSLAQVIATINKNSSNFAIGVVENSENSYLLKANGQKDSVVKVKKLHITPTIKIDDVAKVYFGHYKNSAMYSGNTKDAIALSIQRSISADVLKTIDNVDKKLKELKNKYKSINIDVSDTQKTTIEQSITNMFESLRDAIIMSTIIVFLFLASFRQILIVLFTIPLVYASTIAMMWLTGIDFNVVTLTAVILALGLLLDDTVVVMENIERHYKELSKPIKKAVIDGTKEIMFADLSGTVTTMIALAPMMFVGGYPQTVFAPLVGTLLLALLASYVISIIAVPLLSLWILAIDYKWLIAIENWFHKIINKFNNSMQKFFSSIVDAITSYKILGFFSVVILLAMFAISVKFVMPAVGKELMPPMDTGAVNIKITTNSNLPINKSKEILQKVNKIIQNEEKLLRVSSSVGSEAGVLSIGSGSGVDHISIVATYVDRFKRDRDIWEMARSLKSKIMQIPNVKYLEVSPFGSTALASIRGNVDAKLSSDELDRLPEAASQVYDALLKTKGVVSAMVTWDMDKKVFNLNIKESEALKYGLTREDITNQLKLILRGAFVATYPRANSRDYMVRVWVEPKKVDTLSKVSAILIDTKMGKIPLNKVATLSYNYEPSLITRDGLEYTIEVYGNREKAAISHIMDNFENNLKNIKLPQGVKLEQIGDIKQFKESTSRMIGAIVVALFLIFLALIVLFGNIKVSLMMLFSIPLTLIGASWTLLLMNMHISMSAMMGFVLLAGVIVNNAILLIHFAIDKIREGLGKKEAMLEAIHIRTRPVLMTAFAVSAGMWPVASGNAIGLERLAPLGAVAVGGLIVGTLMTLIFIPTLFIWTVNEKTLKEED